MLTAELISTHHFPGIKKPKIGLSLQTDRTSAGIEPSEGEGEGEETAGLRDNTIPAQPSTVQGKGRARKTVPATTTEMLQSLLIRKTWAPSFLSLKNKR